MSETLIFEDDIGTAYVESFSFYAVAISPPPFSLTIGEKYKVVWDGQSYDVEAVDGSAVGSEVIMGNGTPFGLDDNDEPFAVVYTSNAGVIFAALTDTASTVHTVAVYHVTEDEPSVDPEEPEEPVVQEGIVLKDRNGNDVAYYGIETVTFDTTTEGKQQTYTKGVAVEGLEIVPDFSGGDMAITAAEGTLVKSATVKVPDTLTPDNVRNGVEVGGVAGTFIGDTEAVEVDLSMADGDMVVEPSADGKVMSSVTIKKPETLIPENIAEGVDIAGIVGTLAAGGSGGAGKVAFGTVVNSGGDNIEIEHGLGCVPDIIFMMPITSMSGWSSKVHLAWGISKAFSEKLGAARVAEYFVKGNTNSGTMYVIKAPIDTTTNAQPNCLYGATEEVFYLPYNMDRTNTFLWIAIGGLT